MRRATCLLAMGLAAACGSVAGCRVKPELIQGEVDATEVDVAPKIAGRLRALHVNEGSHVEQGALLAELESPEIDARLAQALAAEDVARAQQDKAWRGAREEEIRQARNIWERALAAEVLARTTFERLQRLFGDGVVAAQRRDEAETQWKTAQAASGAARAALDLATAGTRSEDRRAAEATLARARGASAEAQAFERERRLWAPLAAEVSRRHVEPGELVAPGLPVVTLTDLSDLWVTFHLREDQLSGLQVGTRLEARIPALAMRVVPLEVFYLAVQGDFATWRSTAAQGGFDLKTFEVRARPQKPEGLRPGMSALLERDPEGPGTWRSPASP